MTLRNILTIEEHITYAPVPGDASKTMMTQEAKITVGASLMGTSMLESQLVSNIEKNAAKVGRACPVACPVCMPPLGWSPMPCLLSCSLMISIAAPV